jgi:hypothetical protein
MNGHRHGCHAPTHIGPAWFLQSSQRSDEESLSASLFGRDLQATERDRGGRLRHPAETRRDGRTAQRLFPGPEGIRRGAGTNEDDPIQRDAPPGQGRGVKLSLAIDDDEDRALPRTQGLGGGEESEGEPSASRFGKPLGEACGGESPLREKLIERRNAAGAGSLGRRTASSSPLKLVGQGRQGGKETCHACSVPAYTFHARSEL